MAKIIPAIDGLVDTSNARVLLYQAGREVQAPVDGIGLLTSADAATTYQPLDATLTSLAAYNTNGILTQTASDTFTGRTITGTANKITVTDGSGVAGNPTLTIPDAVTLVNPTVTGTLTVTAGTIVDDEGAWTPILTFGGGSTGIAYTTQTGRYTKIGRLVSIEGEIQLSSKGSSTGTAAITGLPFTVATSNGILGTYISGFTGITAGGFCLAVSGQSSLGPRQNTTTGSASSTDAVFTATSRIMFGGTYSI